MKHLKHFSIKRDRKPWVATFVKRELGDVYDRLQQQGNAIVQLEETLSNKQTLITLSESGVFINSPK